MWAAAAALCFVGTATLILLAVGYQIRETRPQGEGELFVMEGTKATRLLADSEASGQNIGAAVRHVRNSLDIEAVGVVDEGGIYMASTSPNWVGSVVEPPMLRGMVADGRFGAVTFPIPRPLMMDGVEEWSVGDSLYQVVQPLDDGRAVVLSYDVSSLLERRAAARGIRSLTLVLGGSGVVLLVAGVLLLVGRAGARRRVAEAARETELMQAHNRELELRNLELDAAREQAERALALAEETNRIRSEFVLMINHELRTPLTSVVTGAELLMEDGLDAVVRDEVLVDVARDARRLQEMISQMLTVARVENRGLGYTLRDVPLSAVMNRIDAAGGEVVSWVDDLADRCLDPSKVVLRTDPDPLSHLVVSLAENAVTHGASRVRLAVTDRLSFVPMTQIGELTDHSVFILIADDGPGIDPEFLPHAFEKFEKHGRSSGTGLGLYLARLMIEAVEGALAVTTAPTGTTVAVAVPAVTVPTQEVVAP